jgi:hypothetical protein
VRSLSSNFSETDFIISLYKASISNFERASDTSTDRVDVLARVVVAEIAPKRLRSANVFIYIFVFLIIIKL